MANIRHLQEVPASLIKKWWWRKPLLEADKFSFAPLFYECLVRHKDVETLCFYLENAPVEKLGLIFTTEPFLRWFRDIYRKSQGNQHWMELSQKERGGGRIQGRLLSYLHVEPGHTLPNGLPDLRTGKWYNNWPSVDFYNPKGVTPTPCTLATIKVNTPDTILLKDFLVFVQRARKLAIKQGYMAKKQLKTLSQQHHPEKTSNIEPKLTLLEVWDCEVNNPRISPQSLFGWRKKNGFTVAVDKGGVGADIKRAKQLVDINVWQSVAAKIALADTSIPLPRGQEELRKSFGLYSDKSS